MKRKIIFLGICILFLSSCAPVTMMRYQERLSQMKWIAGAAQAGHLDLVIYGTNDPAVKGAIFDAMDGYTYGPEVPLKLSNDHEKGARVVLVLSPGHNVYGDHVCSAPEHGFQFNEAAVNKSVIAFCYNDLAYGTVSSVLDEDVTLLKSEAYIKSYRAIIRYLTDPRYEMMEMRSNCSNINNC
jgi:hypothetical protein